MPSGTISKKEIQHQCQRNHLLTRFSQPMTAGIASSKPSSLLPLQLEQESITHGWQRSLLESSMGLQLPGNMVQLIGMAITSPYKNLPILDANTEGVFLTGMYDPFADLEQYKREHPEIQVI